ncbi:hypothetical protein GGR56DRAFT_671309 [Xylariaceae sp. FL0804]|nr:hypothetical protein GGR56DRAFT_671309 [Xylariaceae sp. FL0804]
MHCGLTANGRLLPLLGAIAAFSTPLNALFTCNSSTAAGFAPSCCMHINGQVGINCTSAFQNGETDPTWECNEFVYNITGCCQTIGYQNPITNNTVDLCATSVDGV